MFLSDRSPIIGYACHSLPPLLLLVNLIYVSLTCEDGNSKLVIGPESNHCLLLSLTNCCLVNFIDVTLACEDANSKLVEVVTVADVDDEDRVGNSLLQIWKLSLGHKAKLLFRF